MICPKCGQDVIDGSPMCPACGQPLAAAPAAEPTAAVATEPMMGPTEVPMANPVNNIPPMEVTPVAAGPVTMPQPMASPGTEPVAATQPQVQPTVNMNATTPTTTVGPTNTTATPAAPAKGGSIGWAILGFIIPIVGLVLFLVWRKNKPGDAKMAGVGALISFGLSMVLGVITTVLGLGAVATTMQSGDFEGTMTINGEEYTIE